MSKINSNKFMEKLKKIVISCIVVVVLFVIVIYCRSSRPQETTYYYSMYDFGAELVESDCSKVKDMPVGPQVSLSFTMNKVEDVRGKINALVAEYGGVITSDSFSSYLSAPTPIGEKLAPMSDSANITATFDKRQLEFLNNLSLLVKNAGGKSTGYNYSEDNQSGLSSYTTCTDEMQVIQADVLKLGIFTEALKKEKSPGNVARISQMISEGKTNLQNDVNTLNSFFKGGTKPSVAISITNN